MDGDAVEAHLGALTGTPRGAACGKRGAVGAQVCGDGMPRVCMPVQAEMLRAGGPWEVGMLRVHA